MLLATAAHLPTSKSGPNMVCFVHFASMCFSLQRRAIFPHPNFKKVVPSWCVLYILACKRVSRYSGVQFFISPLNIYLRARRFSEPTFRPSGNTNHWKNTAFRDFPNISRDCIFFLLLYFVLALLSSDSASLLCFSSLHILGS